MLLYCGNFEAVRNGALRSLEGNYSGGEDLFVLNLSLSSNNIELLHNDKIHFLEKAAREKALEEKQRAESWALTQMLVS